MNIWFLRNLRKLVLKFLVNLQNFNGEFDASLCSFSNFCFCFIIKFKALESSIVCLLRNLRDVRYGVFFLDGNGVFSDSHVCYKFCY